MITSLKERAQIYIKSINCFTEIEDFISVKFYLLSDKTERLSSKYNSLKLAKKEVSRPNK